MKARSRLAHNRGMVLREYVGFSQYERPEQRKMARWQTGFFILLTTTLSLGAMAYGRISSPTELLSPIPVQAQTVSNVEIKEVIIDKNQNVDTWIGDAVDEFLPTHKSEARMIMHCLAHRENGHGSNPSGHGDNGLASGPFQFHQSTWEGYRKLMIKAGKATEIGSVYDFKEAARTTAWAISTGRGKAWGPILRDSKGNNFASCQTPSWYPKENK